MKVAIFGGTGYVGSYIIDELINNNMVPRLLVREGSDSKVIQPDQCEIVNGSIEDEDAINVFAGWFARPRSMLHTEDIC